MELYKENVKLLFPSFPVLFFKDITRTKIAFFYLQSVFQSRSFCQLSWTSLVKLISDYSNAPVAQLDRAPDYGSGGLEFESLRARHLHLKKRSV
jgi:hypothetical protein